MQSGPERVTARIEPVARPTESRLETLLDPVALDQTDDLQYLLSLCGEALRRQTPADSAAMAEWVVDEWCRVVGHDPAAGERFDDRPAEAADRP